MILFKLVDPYLITFKFAQHRIFSSQTLNNIASMRKNQGDKSYHLINKSHAVIVAADRCNTSPVQAWTTQCSEQKGDPEQTEAPGGPHKYFFDRDAHPRTNLNYPQKNRMTLKFKSKKVKCPKIQTPKNRMTQDAMFVKV